MENVLAHELTALGANNVIPGRGGVAFEGEQELVYQCNLWLRTAVRVLQPILEAEVTSTDELYDAVREMDWKQYLTLQHTFAVDCNVRDSAITHSMYAALRVKDAICDQFRERTGARPSINVEEPMVPLNLHVHKNVAVLSLDSTGTTLHKRGYRTIMSRAPLNEALAAALVQLTGWKGDVPLIDPMCGSGTIPIEAAWIALKRPPGLTRKRFGFHGWLDFDRRLWTHLRDEARDNVLRELPAPVTGSDARSDAIGFSTKNSRAAGIGNLLRFEKKDVKDFHPPEGPGVILFNPPYGERLGEEKELRGLYRTLGEVIRDRCQGWDVWMFSGNARLVKEMGLNPIQEHALFNGKLPCQLLQLQ